MQTQAIYNFIQERFSLNSFTYNVVLTPELYGEEDGLDFTGCYIGILIHPKTGTFSFKLTPEGDREWTMERLDVNEPEQPENEGRVVFLPVPRDNASEQSEEVDVIEEPDVIHAAFRYAPEPTEREVIAELDRIIEKSINGGQ